MLQLNDGVSRQTSRRRCCAIARDTAISIRLVCGCPGQPPNPPAISRTLNFTASLSAPRRFFGSWIPTRAVKSSESSEAFYGVPVCDSISRPGSSNSARPRARSRRPRPPAGMTWKMRHQATNACTATPRIAPSAAVKQAPASGLWRLTARRSRAASTPLTTSRHDRCLMLSAVAVDTALVLDEDAAARDCGWVAMRDRAMQDMRHSGAFRARAHRAGNRWSGRGKLPSRSRIRNRCFI
jgi:hypothetical protein